MANRFCEISFLFNDSIYVRSRQKRREKEKKMLEIVTTKIVVNHMSSDRLQCQQLVPKCLRAES